MQHNCQNVRLHVVFPIVNISLSLSLPQNRFDHWGHGTQLCNYGELKYYNFFIHFITDYF